MHSQRDNLLLLLAAAMAVVVCQSVACLGIRNTAPPHFFSTQSICLHGCRSVYPFLVFLLSVSSLVSLLSQLFPSHIALAAFPPLLQFLIFLPNFLLLLIQCSTFCKSPPRADLRSAVACRKHGHQMGVRVGLQEAL